MTRGVITIMKKKLLSVLLSVAMTIALAVPAMANESTVITWEAEDESEKKEEKPADVAPPAAAAVPYLALGADLTQDQLATVLTLMGLAGQDVSQFNVVYITNQMEHQYLDSYVDPAVIGTKSLSSVLVRSAESGHGVKVVTQNINYCTEGMYRNALLTAGVKDADVIVVGPSPISGTAGLIGALKAYEAMSGKNVTENAIDTAMNELVTTGELAESSGNSEEIAELVAFIKAQIAGKKLDTREEIDEAVREAVKEYGVELSEDEINQIVDLMVKIKKLGLDYNTLLDQAEDLYKKYGDKITSLDDLKNMDGEMKGEIAKNAVSGFFKRVGNGIKGFFKGLFGK